MPVLPGQRLGSLIGGIFGLIYVEVNAGSLPQPWGMALRVAAGVVFAGLIVLLALARGAHTPADPGARSGFGRGYWLVVAGEIAAIPAGAALLNGPAGLPHAVVGWVSVVVGVHFMVLAVIWRLRLFRLLGAAITLCGVAGMSAAIIGAPAAVIATVAGVLPGVLLLAAGYAGAAGAVRQRPARGDARDPAGAPELDRCEPGVAL
jgi:hypothetical protein